MRTLFVGGQESPNGINSYIFNLAAELNKRQFKSKVISFGASSQRYSNMGVDVIQYKAPASTVLAIPFIMYRCIPYALKHRRDFDVVMMQGIDMAFIPAWILRMAGMKVCFVKHSLAEDNPKRGKVAKILLMIANYISFIGCGSHVLTVSNSKAYEIYNRYRKKVDVLPCGVNLPSPNSQDSQILKKNNIRPLYYYLTIGRFDPVKNLETLIDAFKMVNYSQFQLVVAGDYRTPYGMEIVERAKGCNNIIFPGIVTGTDKDTLLRNCMSYCLVSSSEGLPIALLEGMAYGKPCVVTEIPAIKEVIQNYNLGIWSNVRDINSLAKALELFKTKDFSNQGSMLKEIVIKNYTWKSICDKYIEYINNNF